MMQHAQAHWLPDGRRLHLNHGPIDLIVEAFGEAGEVQAAYGQAVARFRTVLSELVEELAELRRPATAGRPRPFAGSMARRMEASVVPLAEVFVTPMAAVAGAVADEVLAALLAGRTVERAYVNNGGDIALYLAEGQELSLAVAGTGHGLADRIRLSAAGPARGVATSGWRGRSLFAGHCRCGDGAGANGGAGRRGGDHHRQCRRSGRPPGRAKAAGNRTRAGQ